MRQILLTGSALKLAQEIADHWAEYGKDIALANAEAERAQAAAQRLAMQCQEESDDLLDKLKAEIGLAPEDHCHPDFRFLEQTGCAFVVTNCQSDEQVHDQPPPVLN